MSIKIKGVVVINIFGKVTIALRKCIKLILLLILSGFIIVGVVALFYKPIYEVSVNEEILGYTADKSELQARINEHISSNEGENVAFVQVDAMPTYKLCLLKKDVTTNDEEIFAKVTESGTKYYKYYAITDDKKEKVYMSSFEEAEEVIAELKKKDSANIKKIGIVEKYDTELKDFTSVEKSVSKLYEKKVVIYKPTYTYSAPSSSNYSSGRSGKKVELGIALINPTSGTITSRYGSNDSVRDHTHAGLDIAAPKGTPIKAAAAGTVTYSGNANDGYGYYVVISHGNGVQTVYAHCSKLLVKKGQKVSQGELIAKVGSTGNSTGNHLHFEVRKNGITYDPQHYVY